VDLGIQETAVWYEKDSVRSQESFISIRRLAIAAVKTGPGSTTACCLPFLGLCFPVDGLGSFPCLVSFWSFPRLGSFEGCGVFDAGCGAFGGFTGNGDENLLCSTRYLQTYSPRVIYTVEQTHDFVHHPYGVDVSRGCKNGFSGQKHIAIITYCKLEPCDKHPRPLR
jgi:hypothetical protein